MGIKIAARCVRSVKTNFALDVEIGTVRDRLPQSMHITCVCRS